MKISECDVKLLEVGPLTAVHQAAKGSSGWMNIMVVSRIKPRVKKPKVKFFLGWNGSRFADNNEISLLRKLFPQEAESLQGFLAKNYGELK